LTTESNLKLSVNFDRIGHVAINGEFIERHDKNNQLIYEIFSDQSYIKGTLADLGVIINKYGGLEGIK
jgi:hypothetical protein